MAAATLIEAAHPGVKVFSLPCVDDQHEFGRHIDLGVKGRGDDLGAAYLALKHGLAQLGVRCGPETVR